MMPMIIYLLSSDKRRPGSWGPNWRCLLRKKEGKKIKPTINDFLWGPIKWARLRVARKRVADDGDDYGHHEADWTGYERRLL